MLSQYWWFTCLFSRWCHFLIVSLCHLDTMYPPAHLDWQMLNYQSLPNSNLCWHTFWLSLPLPSALHQYTSIWRSLCKRGVLICWCGTGIFINIHSPLLRTNPISPLPNVSVILNEELYATKSNLQVNLFREKCIKLRFSLAETILTDKDYLRQPSVVWHV